MGDEPFTVDVLGKTDTGIAGRDIVFPDGPCELETHLVEVAPGEAVGGHRHPGPCWMHVLEGSITAVTEAGDERTYEAGETFIEDAGMWVDNRNPGSSPARFLALAVGGTGEPKIRFEE